MAYSLNYMDRFIQEKYYFSAYYAPLHMLGGVEEILAFMELCLVLFHYSSGFQSLAAN